MTRAAATPGAAARGPLVVVKLGGDVLEGAALRTVAADLAGQRRIQPDTRIMVVHGGGPQATELSGRLGLTALLVGGRRVTDAPTLEVMKMVVAGRLNVDLVAALRAEQVPAVGLSGTSGLVNAQRRPPVRPAGGGGALVDFGLVGDVTGFDLRLLDLLLGAAYVPVVACLALGEPGYVLNINADVVASQLACTAQATALVAVTAVGAVRRDKNDPSTRIARLTVGEARAAIASGAIQGGMIPKLEEAFAPLAAGVKAVHIVSPGEIRHTLAHPGSVGTLLVGA